MTGYKMEDVLSKLRWTTADWAHKAADIIERQQQINEQQKEKIAELEKDNYLLQKEFDDFVTELKNINVFQYVTYIKNTSYDGSVVSKIHDAVKYVTGVDYIVKSRKRDVSLPRFLFMYLCRIYTPLTLIEIGREVNRDHTSVVYGLQTARDLIDTDDEFKGKFEKARQIIEGNGIPKGSYTKIQGLHS